MEKGRAYIIIIIYVYVDLRNGVLSNYLTIRGVSLNLLATTGHNFEGRRSSCKGGKASNWRRFLNSERCWFETQRCHHWRCHFNSTLLVGCYYYYYSASDCLLWATKHVPLSHNNTNSHHRICDVFLCHVACNVWQSVGYGSAKHYLEMRSNFHLLFPSTHPNKQNLSYPSRCNKRGYSFYEIILPHKKKMFIEKIRRKNWSQTFHILQQY